MGTQTIPIVMTEEYWANTHFSIARYCGSIKAFGHEYVIVNKDGLDIYACSVKAEIEGREKAIEPGEPCDLCRTDFVSIYHKLGRDKFLEFVQAHPELQTVKQAIELLKKEHPGKGN